MPDTTWKQAVATVILEIVRRDASPLFTLDQVDAHRTEFQNAFPQNRHIRQKICEILQHLRDDHFIRFLGGGRYEVNLSFNDLILPFYAELPAGVTTPEVRTALRAIRLRDTFLAIEMKTRYGHLCQVCRTPVILADSFRYAEGHHLRPLGGPHLGPDVSGNIIVLCPNHHVMFDRGAIAVIPTTMQVKHAVDQVLPMELYLYREDWHRIEYQYLEYHYYNVFRGARAS